MLVVIGLEIVSLFLRAVSANRRDIDHTSSELNKCAPLDRNVKVCDVVEAEVDEALDVLLAKEVFDRGLFEWKVVMEGVESVFAKAVGELWQQVGGNLLLDLLQV